VNWARRLNFRAALIAILAVSLLAGGCVSQERVRSTEPTEAPFEAPSPSPSPTPLFETREISEPQFVPRQEQVVRDPTLFEGTSRVKQEGSDGVETIHFSVTYRDGSEITRTEVSRVVTDRPAPRIILIGIKKRTQGGSGGGTCTSGGDGYTNSDGDWVQSPCQSDSAPAGATAECGDGTYSFSQHRSGTCSHHGGVARWL
jgi:uncharacterized protein DUF3761/surface rod structure-forming protein G